MTFAESHPPIRDLNNDSEFITHSHGAFDRQRRVAAARQGAQRPRLYYSEVQSYLEKLRNKCPSPRR